MKITEIKPEVYEMAKRAEERLGARFREIDAVAEHNTRKVMEAFQNHRVSDACFAGTTGYGYDDLGRETLDKIYADVFGTEAALVRIQFVNGTHALTAAMFSLAEPGQKILAVTGMPSRRAASWQHCDNACQQQGREGRHDLQRKGRDVLYGSH